MEYLHWYVQDLAIKCLEFLSLDFIVNLLHLKIIELNFSKKQWILEDF